MGKQAESMLESEIHSSGIQFPALHFTFQRMPRYWVTVLLGRNQLWYLFCDGILQALVEISQIENRYYVLLCDFSEIRVSSIKRLILCFKIQIAS